MTEFSVLLPVYRADEPQWFTRALESATVEQQLPPTEVVLVQDGPVPEPLAEAIDAAIAASSVPVHLVRLAEQSGLGKALQTGLQECRYEVVARADADDLSMPERFALQVPLVADGVDLLGSAMQEFDDEDGELGPIRQRPHSDEAIRSYAAFHNPFNHPTVVYRRSAVLAAGGYEDMPFMEDYWLFARMIARGARVQNLAQALVRYRTVEALYARRGGWGPLRSDWILQRKLRKIGVTNSAQMVRNLAQRTAYRMVPDSVRRWAYPAMIARR